ncbi:MAG: UDP-glucose 4-epimerase GalE [Rhodospirillaceae bacterium]|nr:UDP-glucose 4-epimerase GalE [Rhodospirillaceae bacterium]
MQRLLIAGGAGYIGSHVVYAALDAGYSVVVVDNLSTGVRENLPDSVPVMVGDIGDRGFMDHVLETTQPDGVMHFAGSIIVSESTAHPLAYYHNNVSNSLALISACVSAGVERFVFSSSAAVYGAIDGDAAAETAPLRPSSPYGWSKLFTEQILRDVAQAHGLTYAALRYFNVAGADGRGRSGQSGPNATHLIKIACQVAQGKRDVMEIYGADYPTPDGTCVRDYLHVSDLAEAHVRVFEHLSQASGNLILNCGNGCGYSVREVIAAVERVCGHTLPVVEAPRRAGDPPYLVACPDKLAALLNWRPQYVDLDEMIRSALAWESDYRSNG